MFCKFMLGFLSTNRRAQLALDWVGGTPPAKDDDGEPVRRPDSLTITHSGRVRIISNLAPNMPL
jgi:hypothetical protein